MLKLKPMLALAALSVALLSIAPVSQAQSPAREFVGEGGETVYKNICAACHLADGSGYPGLYPALAKNPRLAAASYPISVVIRGQRAMPSFAGMLSDQQVSDVVNYVQTHLGNSYAPTATPAAVKAVRP